MTTVRCPSCDAAVPADAAWCTLCFATLRQQAAAPAESSLPGPSLPEPSLPEPRVPEPSVLESSVLQPAVVAAPVLSAPVAAPVATAVVEKSAPTWPCSGCSDRVPMDEMACPSCGTAFMGGVNHNVSLTIPGVGDIVGMSAGAKFGLIAGGATIFTTVIVVLLLILGHIF